jgi:dipeptidyl aminopeptidase/acylaminoacyl peptidase
MSKPNSSLPIILVLVILCLVFTTCGALILGASIYTGLFPFRSSRSIPEVVEQIVTVTVAAIAETPRSPLDDPDATPVPGNAPPGSAMRLVYIGLDGNIWLLDTPSAAPRQITQHATPPGVPGDIVSYNDLQLSSDGRYIAYRRDDGLQLADRTDFKFSLWVLDLESGASHQVLDESPLGYSWQPGSHLLAFVPAIAEGYFTGRGEQPDAALAQGILGYHVDSGKTSELVQPERGYAMARLTWSPDGRFLGFDEIVAMEGRGPTAFYDLTTGHYNALDEALGSYAWSPDSAYLAYDRLTYTATGSERIFLRPLGGAELLASPDYKQGYAILPAFSPLGDQLAYLYSPGMPDDEMYIITLQSFPQGDPLQMGHPVNLGEFESVQNLSWSPDGSRLIFAAGPWGAQQILQLDLQDGTTSVLAQGSQPRLSVVP